MASSLEAVASSCIANGSTTWQQGRDLWDNGYFCNKVGVAQMWKQGN